MVYQYRENCFPLRTFFTLSELIWRYSTGVYMLKSTDSSQTTPFAITCVIYNQILNEFGIFTMDRIPSLCWFRGNPQHILLKQTNASNNIALDMRSHSVHSNGKLPRNFVLKYSIKAFHIIKYGILISGTNGHITGISYRKEFWSFRN